MFLWNRFILPASSATTMDNSTSTTVSSEATKAYCKPNTCFNPNCKKQELIEMKKCSRCKWAKYCSQDCQRSHWKSHKKDCDKLTAHHGAMYGRQGYIYNKKESHKLDESNWSKWNVKKMNGNSLSLECSIMGKRCTYDNCLVKDDLKLLKEIETYFDSGRGCSVALERQKDGADKVMAAYNQNIPL